MMKRTAPAPLDGTEGRDAPTLTTIGKLAAPLLCHTQRAKVPSVQLLTLSAKPEEDEQQHSLL
jgi:hypothetical protein